MQMVKIENFTRKMEGHTVKCREMLLALGWRSCTCLHHKLTHLGSTAGILGLYPLLICEFLKGRA